MTALEHLLNIQNILAQQRAELLKAKRIVDEMQKITNSISEDNYEEIKR